MRPEERACKRKRFYEPLSCETSYISDWTAAFKAKLVIVVFPSETLTPAPFSQRWRGEQDGGGGKGGCGFWFLVIGWRLAGARGAAGKVGENRKFKLKV